MKVAAVIVAAGSGQRAGGEKPKQYQLIGGKPVLRWTLESFLSHSAITHVQTVIGAEHHEDFIAATKGLALPAPVQGGASRQDSCRIGVEACAAHAPDLILIHDAARPFISHGVISAVIARLQDADAVVPGLAVADTLKQARAGLIEKTVDRSTLYYMQTPQGFRFEKIRAAHEKAHAQTAEGLTDDAAVAEFAGMNVFVVQGEARNRKLTTSHDITMADLELNQTLFAQRPDVRMGQGIDFHVFVAGKSLWLCGVEIPYTHKLKGHSDADVALHAITDAILGTIGEGDIGTHFPPTDKQWKDARSSIFVAKARELLEAKGGMIANVDVTILAEAPKISPHIAAMKAELSRQLGLAEGRIAIKATTTEKMGAIGRKEGMAAIASVTVRLPL
jgi:2-C-methyl-D-erythritol 4-phosphate cytidylyltransferase / 2-C-methyl-D-erythritol 2,4-cyclodiphosphate synthase